MQILRNLLLPGSCGNGSIEYLITSSPSSSSQSSYSYEYLVRFVFLVQKPEMPFSRRAGWCRSQNTFFNRSKGRKTKRINRTYRISRSKSSVYRVSSNLDLFVKFWYCVSSLAFLVQNYTNLCNPASFVQRISFRKLSHFKGFLGKILSNSVSQKFLTKAENRGNIFYTRSWFWICKKCR